MVKTPSKSFWSKYHERWLQTRSLVCIGLDSDLQLLPPVCQKAKNPIADFNFRIVDATIETAACYKSNLAFYLKDGLRGLEALYQTLEYIPEEVPVIIDCKVGDIGNTMDAYVSSFFDSLCADAITINPLMGKDVISSLLKNPIAFAFVLNLTSNPSAADFLARDNLCSRISELIMQYPKERLGAVVGATQTSELARMRELLPDRLFLIPGIGAQGGDLEMVIKHSIVDRSEPHILINSSRGIIFKDNSDRFAEYAKSEAIKLKDSILHLLDS